MQQQDRSRKRHSRASRATVARQPIRGWRPLLKSEQFCTDLVRTVTTLDITKLGPILPTVPLTTRHAELEGLYAYAYSSFVSRLRTLQKTRQEDFEREVAARFGLVPNFFALLQTLHTSFANYGLSPSRPIWMPLSQRSSRSVCSSICRVFAKCVTALPDTAASY